MNGRLRLFVAVAVVFLALAGINAWLQHLAAPAAPDAPASSPTTPSTSDTYVITELEIGCLDNGRQTTCTTNTSVGGK